MNRTGWLGVLLLGLLVAGVAARVAWPSAEPPLPCGPDEVRWIGPPGEEVARCAPSSEGRPAPAGARLALGGKLDLNRATEAELTLLPGVGRSLARALVRERDALGGAFPDWTHVDAVRGVGDAKLQTLRQYTTLGATDAGLPDEGAEAPGQQ